MPQDPTPAADRARDALAARLLSQNVAAYEIACVYLGERLGLYRALADRGPLTARELATAARVDERYAREWLEQQAVAGLLDVVAPSEDASQRRYGLPAGHEDVLVSRDHLAFMAPLARFTAGVYSGLPLVADAFRSGRGVEYAAFGADAREGQADQNRTMFVNLLAQEWLPRVPEAHARLSRPGARVADVGCGTGSSSIAIARGYPHARVDGFDLDAPSIELARANAEAAGVADRVRFEVRDAGDDSLAGRYDLVTMFEAPHDLARPVEALRVMRKLLAPGGSLLIADERTRESFEPRGPESERLFYAWSVLFCLPTGRASEPSEATGTVMRPSKLAEYAERAGLRCETLAIEHDLWRFYRLTSSGTR